MRSSHIAKGLVCQEVWGERWVDLYGGAQEDIPGFEPGGKAINAAFLALGRYKGKGSGILGVNSQGEVVLGGGEGSVWVHVI